MTGHVATASAAGLRLAAHHGLGPAPRVLATCPHPGGFGDLPLRFGAHNLHENQPGGYRSERVVFATYFSAGVRLYDLAEPEHPAEVAHWIPEPPPGQPVPQINDLFVDSGGLVWVTDRIGPLRWRRSGRCGRARSRS